MKESLQKKSEKIRSYLAFLSMRLLYQSTMVQQVNVQKFIRDSGEEVLDTFL